MAGQRRAETVHRRAACCSTSASTAAATQHKVSAAGQASAHPRWSAGSASRGAIAGVRCGRCTHMPGENSAGAAAFSTICTSSSTSTLRPPAMARLGVAGLQAGVGVARQGAAVCRKLSQACAAGGSTHRAAGDRRPRMIKVQAPQQVAWRGGDRLGPAAFVKLGAGWAAWRPQGPPRTRDRPTVTGLLMLASVRGCGARVREGLRRPRPLAGWLCRGAVAVV